LIDKLKKIGGLLTLISFVFLIAKIWEFKTQLVQQVQLDQTFYSISVAACFYCITCILIASAWYHFIHSLNVSATFSSIYKIYSRTQIARYLPGNVFHFAGRQIMGRSINISQGDILMASIFECVLLAAAAFMLIVLGLSLHPVIQPVYNNTILVFCLIMFCSFIAFLSVGHRYCNASPVLMKFFGKTAAFNTKKWLNFIFLPFILYTAYLLLNCILVWSLGYYFGFFQATFVSISTVISIYTASWLIGFITPGSPGGIGIREALMATLFLPVIGSSPALTLCLLLRIVTSAGDLIFYFTSYLTKYKKELHQLTPP